MAVSKAQIRATTKYVKNTYDRIEIKVPKGNKQVINDFAKRKNKSLNGFIVEAIDEKMEREEIAISAVDGSAEDEK